MSDVIRTSNERPQTREQWLLDYAIFLYAFHRLNDDPTPKEATALAAKEIEEMMARDGVTAHETSDQLLVQRLRAKLREYVEMHEDEWGADISERPRDLVQLLGDPVPAQKAVDGQPCQHPRGTQWTMEGSDSTFCPDCDEEFPPTYR